MLSLLIASPWMIRKQRRSHGITPKSHTDQYTRSVKTLQAVIERILKDSEVQKHKTEKVQITTLEVSSHHSTVKSRYTISNERVCSGYRPELLIWIYSAPGNRGRRLLLRDTWANATLYQPITTRIVFSLAATLDSAVQKEIEKEHREYGDIVQDGSFIDSYFNLTFKAQGMLRWANAYCKRVKLLFKTDDDSLILPARLTRWMVESFKAQDAWPSRSVIGEVWYNPPAYRIGKYAVPYEQVPEETYAPKACPGSGYFTSGDALSVLVQAIDQVKFLWLEDMYTTGRLAHNAQLNHIPINRHHIHIYDPEQTPTYLRNAERSVFIVGQVPTYQLPALWNEFKTL